MCNRSNDEVPMFWVNPCESDFEPSGEPLSELNVTSLNIAINSANTALHTVRDFKDKFRNMTIDTMGYDPEANYLRNSYHWLPQLPKVSGDHLRSLKWQESLLTLYKHLQTISVAVEQLVIDFNRDPFDHKSNYSVIEGHMTNVLCELHDSIADNNLKIVENVKRDIMPDALRDVCNSKTDRTVRDWIILRELVHILEYTVSVCTYLTKERTGGINT